MHLIYVLSLMEYICEFGGLQADLKGGSWGAELPPRNKKYILVFRAADRS